MIEVDIRDLFPRQLRAATSPAVAYVLVEDIAEAARAKWIQLSFEQLTSSQQDYTAAISGVKQLGDVHFIELNGVWPNMVEQGFGPFNLRDTLLKPSDPKVQRTSDGLHRYRPIMFRLGTPGTKNRNFRRLTDLYAKSMGESHGRRLGRRAHKLLKKLEPGESLSAGITSGRYKNQIQARPLQKGELSPAGHRVTHSHATDLFAGARLIDQTPTKSGVMQRAYATFRTISTRQPEGWIHPGYKPNTGADLAGQVDEYIRRVAPSMIQAALDVAGDKDV